VVTSTVKIIRFDLKVGIEEIREDTVALDEAICIFINGEYYRTMITTPAMLKELVVGHLLGEGIIHSLDDLKEIEIKLMKAYVELDDEVDLDLIGRSKVELITTACGSLSTPLGERELKSLAIGSNVHVKAETIFDMIRELNLRSRVYRRTGGTHCAMLATVEGGILAFSEDVGRHNAVDKVIGAGLLDGVNFGECVLVSSGRQSSEIVLKVARSGIPIIASVAGPLESGIRVTEATGITLVCFVRGVRMNIYTHQRRIITCEDSPA
jgi:FdhD protein